MVTMAAGQPKPWRVSWSPNHGSRSKPITAIVIHYTGAMTTESTLSWFARPEAKASAHFVIGRDGEIVRCVEDHRRAWHAGSSTMPGTNERDVNTFSLGIELVGTHDSGFTDVQMAALYELITLLVRQYRIRPDRIVSHKAIARPLGRKIDPDGYTNQFNWAKTRSVAQQAYDALPPENTDGDPTPL
jgi:N-acetylmuramoyl-L-alanine amidase